VRRGEVRVLVSRVTGRERPVLVVGNDALNEADAVSWVLTAPIDTEDLSAETLVTVRIVDPVSGVVRLGEVSAVRKERVGKLLGRAAPDVMESVSVALRAALDL
jgi:mRNA-degrading endonuclease toxin of MazEF toxin-antitoxin module